MLDVHSTHFTGARPDGLVEDYHGIHLIFAATVLPASGASRRTSSRRTAPPTWPRGCRWPRPLELPLLGAAAVRSWTVSGRPEPGTRRDA